MAVLNFPDPAAQTPADTFSPTSTPAATSNGVTYVWTDGSWSIASTSNGELLTKDEADSYYVEQSGDNMTGPLTLGGDKITLGDDGSASFAGNVNISDFDGGSGLILAANGTVTSSGNGLFGKRVQGYEQVEGGNNINASYGAVLYSNNATASQATIYARNYDNSGTGNLILCEGPTGGNAFTVNTSGSATFATEVVAGVRDVDGVLMTSTGTVQGVVGGVSQYSLVGTTGNIEAKSYSKNGVPMLAADDAVLWTEADNDANYVTTTDAEGNESRVYNGPTLDVKERLQNLISRLDSLESDEIADDATSTLLLTTVNNLNAQMTKVNNALTAIRTAANAAGTLDQLKTDIAAATADI